MGDETALTSQIRFRISGAWRDRLEEIAHERSEPGDRVTVSDVIRDAIEEQYFSDIDTCQH